MAAAAQEPAFYDILAKSNDPEIPIAKDDLVERIHVGLMIAQGLDPNDHTKDNANYLALEQKLKGMTFTFNQLVPPIERLPVLRLTWPDQVKPPVSHYAVYAKDYGLALSYRGHDYVVADVDTDSVDPNQFARENEP